MSQLVQKVFLLDIEHNLVDDFLFNFVVVWQNQLYNCQFQEVDQNSSQLNSMFDNILFFQVSRKVDRNRLCTILVSHQNKELLKNIPCTFYHQDCKDGPMGTFESMRLSLYFFPLVIELKGYQVEW